MDSEVEHAGGGPILVAPLLPHACHRRGYGHYVWGVACTCDLQLMCGLHVHHRGTPLPTRPTSQMLRGFKGVGGVRFLPVLCF